MNKRVTIKDIAQAAEVSTGAVHLALNNKRGVSEETREKIKRIALELGYQPNLMAASLKRKTITIAVVLPVKTSLNRFFFAYQWDGIRDYFESVRDFNVNLLSVPYYDTYFVPGSMLDMVLEEHKPNGLICTGFIDPKAAAALKRYDEAEVPYVYVGADVPESGRLCSVISPYEMIGSMMAEQMVMQTKGQDGKYLIGVGHAQVPSHYRTVNGFTDYIKRAGLDGRVLYVATDGYAGNRKESFLNAFKGEKIAACCAATARDSMALGEALEISGLAGTIPAIASDVFPETVEFLKRGTFTNLVQKNPYQMAYTAAQTLTEHVIQASRPRSDVLQIGAEMVFTSNLPLYDNGFYRLLT